MSKNVCKGSASVNPAIRNLADAKSVKQRRTTAYQIAEFRLTTRCC
jgi:hypothetical protein